jgi:hypothetical protein
MSEIPQQSNSNGQPVPGSNNGIMNFSNSMPMKNLTSDNESTFGMNRILFLRSYQPPVDYSQPQVGNEIIQRQSVGIRNGFVLAGAKTTVQKKWIGGNRDASNIVSNRRINSSGAVLSKPGAQSFKNPNDNNPRIEALARVRGGGARVPPKVANRPVNWPSYPRYYRIISAGLAAMNTTTGLVTVPGSSANGTSPGFYISDNNKSVALANLTPLSTFKISYNVLTIDKTTGLTTFTNYDIFNNSASQTAMINQLNGLTSSVIVIISTYNEPESVAITGSLSQGFINAMKRCGASAGFGSANGTYTPGNYHGFIHYRGAYVLVGIPGNGVGNGIERYIGTAISGGDPDAVIDLRISISGGKYTYISG